MTSRHATDCLIVVDDDPEMRALLRDVLQEAGFRVEEAADANELFGLLPRALPTTVILDHEMPGDWGIEILPALRRQWPAIPVVVVTAFGGPHLRDEATRRGATAYLDKPFRISELLAIVQRVRTGQPAPPTYTSTGTPPSAGSSSDYA